MLHSPQDFIQLVLPSIIAEREKLFAMFATYRSVLGVPTGVFETGKPDLVVHVHNGNMTPADFTRMNQIRGKFTAKVDDLEIELDREPLRVVEGSVQESREQMAFEPNVLVVLYAGFSAFDEVNGYVIMLRAQIPHATIVIVTCACDIVSKEMILDFWRESGWLNHAVVTSRCGAAIDMRDILFALVATWPIPPSLGEKP